MLATDCWDRSGLPLMSFIKDTAQITGFGVNDNPQRFILEPSQEESWGARLLLVG